MELNIAQQESHSTSSRVGDTVRKIRQNLFLLETITLEFILLSLVFLGWTGNPETAPSDTTWGMLLSFLGYLPVMFVVCAVVVFLGRLLIGIFQSSGWLGCAIVFLFGLAPVLILYIIVWVNSAIAGCFYSEPPAEAEKSL